MKRSSALISAFCAALLATAAPAQQPLSAIDWLDAPPVPVAKPRISPLDEPPVAKGVTVPEVTVMPLDEAVRDTVGLLPPSVTGLPATLWSASREDDLIDLWSQVADEPLPAIQALYYSLLLAEADAPRRTDGRFLASRIETLVRMGAVEPAQALLERAGPVDSAVFAQWFDLTLLSGDEGRACEALRNRPQLHPGYPARIYCTARMGDWTTAALLFDTALALGLLGQTEQSLLAQFLDPETAETALELAPPRDPAPLIFRLYEAVGTPLPTRNLPLAYATADLRNISGWKTEIEAAERLVRTGALSENRLLSLYTDRSPAASGGIWDRVAAVQRLDAALAEGDAAKVARALPEVWRHMRAQHLEVAFARQTGEQLQQLTLPAEVQDLAYRIALLTAGYETARAPRDAGRATRFLAGLAQGAPDASLASSPAEHSVARAFDAPIAAAPEHAALLRDGKLGEAILTAANQFDQAQGHPGDISAALRTLRAVGLEDVARRAALQLLILERSR